jgi:hypothetical protein
MKSFTLFRFQLLPNESSFQTHLVEGINSVQDLVQRKNELLTRAISNGVVRFSYERSRVKFKLEAEYGDFFLLHMNIMKRKLNRTEDFGQKVIEDYPDLYIALDNDPDRQIIAVENNLEAFHRSETVSDILQTNLNRLLKQFNLSIYIAPLTTVGDFWKVVEENRKRIREVEFELVRPNMSNISQTVSEQLKEMERGIEAHKIDLRFKSGEISNLNITNAEDNFKGLVNYAVNGGGRIFIKLRGVRKRINTSDATKEFTIDEAEMAASTAQELAELFKSIFSEEVPEDENS